MNHRIILLLFILFAGLFNGKTIAQGTQSGKVEYITGIDSGKLKGTWTERGANNWAGNILYTCYMPKLNRIHLLSESGIIWSSSLDSIHWKNYNDLTPVKGFHALEVFPTSNKLQWVVASNSGEMQYSSDSGKTWKPSQGMPAIDSRSSINKILKAGDSSIYVFRTDWNPDSGKVFHALYFSQNAGQQFSKLQHFDVINYTDASNFDLHQISLDDSLVFFYYRDSLAAYQAQSGNLVWKRNPAPFLWGEVWLTGGRIGDSLKLVSNVREFMYESNGDASQWNHTHTTTMKKTTPYNFTYTEGNKNRLMVGNSLMFTSSNTGKNWNRFNGNRGFLSNPKDSLHTGINQIARYEKMDGTEFYVVATEGGLYYSNDTLNTVENISLNGLRSSQYYDVLTTGKNADQWYVCSEYQGIQSGADTISGLLNFDQLSLGNAGHISSSDSGKSYWVVFKDSIAYYEQAGTKTPSAVWVYRDTADAELDYPPVVAHPNFADKSYLIGPILKGDTVQKSQVIELTYSNGKINWNASGFNFNLSFQKDESLSGFEISPLDDSLWYAITNKGNFYYSYNAGANWTRASFFVGPLPGSVKGTAIYASAQNIDEVYLAGKGQGTAKVFYSQNRGKDWRPLDSGIRSEVITDLCGVNKDSLLFAATQTGPMVYDQKSNKWYSMQNDTAPAIPYFSVHYIADKKTARFTSWGRGIWDFKLATYELDTTISLSEFKDEQPIQVFPNPATQKINLKSGSSLLGFKYQIWDTQGKTVDGGFINNTILDVSSLPPGQYYIKIEGQFEALPFIKVSP